MSRVSHFSHVVATNDNWKINDQTGQSQEAEIRATTIPPTNDLESAILATLSPGAYTAILAGKNGGTGVGLVEVYDLAQGANSKLANISTRGFVDTGNNVMIGGLIVGGTGGGTARVLVRALGPSIPVAGALADQTYGNLSKSRAGRAVGWYPNMHPLPSRSGRDERMGSWSRN